MELTHTKDKFSLKFDCEGEPEGPVEHGDWFLCQDSKVNISHRERGDNGLFITLMPEVIFVGLTILGNF